MTALGSIPNSIAFIVRVIYKLSRQWYAERTDGDDKHVIYFTWHNITLSVSVMQAGV